MTADILRAPIIVTMGHVDHGKTTLLDRIRGSAIALKEPGAITQSISSTLIPRETILKICGKLLERFKFSITIPGLLLIDTPGHEAFTTLRKRGGSIADIAIVVIDVMEGLMPQTRESLEILKHFKTPFVVAVNKIDRIRGWKSEKDTFVENFDVQAEDVKADFETAFYKIAGQLSNEKFAAERFDRVTDFRTTVACVPISGKTGEGVPDLLTTLAGLSQQFLKQSLITTEQAKGSILEVKEVTGLGTTVDAIIYDGIVKKNDFLVIGGKSPRITKIRALLMPEPLKDIRTEKKFRSIDEARAACGVKINAPGLDDVIAGSPIRTAKSLEEAEKVLEDMETAEDVEISTENDGVMLKADTIGGLEALISVFRNHPIREASIGQITKEDVIKAESNKDAKFRVILGFDTKISEDTENSAKSAKVAVMESNVIYRLLEDYEKWTKEIDEKAKKEELEKVVHAGKIKILPGLVFRSSNPAVVGCEIVGGVVKPGYTLLKSGRAVGEIKQIQSQGVNAEEAKIGDKVAVSITGVTIGRQVKESDVLYTDISSNDYKQLKKFSNLLTEHEKQVMEEIAEMKRKSDSMWGY